MVMVVFPVVQGAKSLAVGKYNVTVAVYTATGTWIVVGNAESLAVSVSLNTHR